MESLRSLSELAPIMKEMLDNNKDVSFMPDGISMLPYLRPNSDRVILTPTLMPLNKYDMAFYTRANGQPILHRVVAKTGDTYTMCGDNQAFLEYGVRESQIIGIVKGFYRGKRFILPKGLRYSVYCRTLHIRRAVLHFIIRVKRKLGKQKNSR